MISALQREKDGTIKLTITVPAAMVKKAWDEVVEKTLKEAELPGFRKGKAPKKLVLEKLDKQKVQEEVLKTVLPKAYVDAVREHNLNPILNPKIHVDPKHFGFEKIEKSEDWQFEAVTCETPLIQLGNYKAMVQKETAKSKIVIPGKEQQPPKFEEIVQVLLASTSVTIPDILIENEVEKTLSQMLDEIKSLGLTLDQYLSSTGKTPETLRNEYRKKAENDIKLELILQKIAEEEKITVEEKEIQEAIQKAKDDNERKNLEANRYLLAAILRQQKTLDFIKNL